MAAAAPGHVPVGRAVAPSSPVAARAAGWSRPRWSGSTARERAAVSAPAGACGPESCSTATCPSPTSSPSSSWAPCASAACAGTRGNSAASSARAAPPLPPGRGCAVPEGRESAPSEEPAVPGRAGAACSGEEPAVPGRAGWAGVRAPERSRLCRAVPGPAAVRCHGGAAGLAASCRCF